MTGEEAVRELYTANEAAGDLPASRVARKVGLSEEQVRRTATFRRVLARKDARELVPDDYAVLGFVAAAGRVVRGAEMCPRLGRPRPAVRKQMDALVDGGYLTRVNGSHGGYAITGEGRRALADRRAADGVPAV